MIGFVAYEGASTLDGKPIVVIVTGLSKSSTNAKTGAMVQVWILRSDMNPLEASATGEDYSICGGCRHRGVSDGLKAHKRTCYVTLVHGPRAVYEAYKRGAYPRLSLEEGARLLAYLLVRIGAYGDPGAVPVLVWQILLAQVKAVTGYTHQWRRRPSLQAFVMASVDSEDEAFEAQTRGWRTFRVAARGELKLPGEVICPASHEAGKKTNCSQCLACGGHSSKARAPIVIQAHGNGAVHIAAA